MWRTDAGEGGITPVQVNKGLSQNSLKVFVHLFQKVVRCRGNALTRTPQSPEYPRLPESSSFGSFLLDKGEKNHRILGFFNKAVAFLRF